MTKYISKYLNVKYSPGMLAAHQKFLDHAKQAAIYAPKTASKRTIKKTAGATDDLTGNEIVNKITMNSLQNNSSRDSQTEEKSIEIPSYI